MQTLEIQYIQNLESALKHCVSYKRKDLELLQHCKDQLTVFTWQEKKTFLNLLHL